MQSRSAPRPRRRGYKVGKRGAGAKPSSASSPIFWSPEGGNPSLIRSTAHQRQRRAVTQRSRNKLASSRKKTASRASPGWSTRKQPQKPRVDAWGGNDGVNSIPKLHERVRTGSARPRKAAHAEHLPRGDSGSSEIPDIRGVSAPHLESNDSDTSYLKSLASPSVAKSREQRRRQQIVRFTSPIVNATTQRSAIARAWKSADKMRKLVQRNLEIMDFKGAIAAANAAAESYDHCIAVIGQSYGHLPNSAKQVAKLSDNIKKMRRVQAQVHAKATQTSRALIAEVVSAVRRNEFGDAIELLTLANQARQWANLRPLSLDDIAEVDDVRPKCPVIDIPESSGTVSADSADVDRFVLPVGSVVNIEHSFQHEGILVYRLVYTDVEHRERSHMSSKWKPWPTDATSAAIGLRVRRPGLACLELQVRPSSASPGLSSLVSTHNLEIV